MSIPLPQLQMAKNERSAFRERFAGIDDPLARCLFDQATADIHLLAELIQAGKCASYVHQQREAATRGSQDPARRIA